MHRLGAYLGFAAGLLICTMLASSPQLEWASAHAQNVAERKKATSNKKVPARVAKDAQKDQARTPFTEQDEQAAVIAGIADARVWGDSEKEFSRLLPQASGPWLAISGGGSDGAYGAGVLTGWTEAGTRPQFAAVTGASIGSLLAPFAFLGPRYDEEVRKTFTQISAADIFEDRKTRDSLFDHWPLKRQVEMRVTRAAAVGYRSRACARPPPVRGHHEPRRRTPRGLEHGSDRRARRRQGARAVPRHSAGIVQHPRIFLPGRHRGRGAMARNSRSCTATARSPRRSSWCRSRCFRPAARRGRRSSQLYVIVNSTARSLISACRTAASTACWAAPSRWR